MSELMKPEDGAARIIPLDSTITFTRPETEEVINAILFARVRMEGIIAESQMEALTSALQKLRVPDAAAPLQSHAG